MDITYYVIAAIVFAIIATLYAVWWVVWGKYGMRLYKNKSLKKKKI